MIALRCPVCGNPVDEAIDGGCSKRCDDIFHGVEEMTDNKAALDAANTEIIKVAAILATGQYNVSEDKDDYSVKVPASVLHLIGKQNERMKTLATRLKNASDVIRKALTTPPAPTVMGG